jgi:hypothetical protein
MSIKKMSRIQRVLELTSLGMTIPEISQTLEEAGYRHHSQITVWRDQNSLEAKEFIRELQRRQLRGIAQAELPLQLKWRAHLLDRLMPHRIEAKTEGQQNIIIKVWKPETEPKKGETKNDAEPNSGDPILSP